MEAHSELDGNNGTHWEQIEHIRNNPSPSPPT